MGPEIIVPLGFFAMVCTLALGIPLVRARIKKVEAGRKPGTARLATDATERLERMEQSLDAVAIEIERISEGQRFLTRLMSERQPGQLDESASRQVLLREAGQRERE
ncbi:MAG: hypothetical protein ACRENI_07300 [Gemmatimonadaceae bacterium]